MHMRGRPPVPLTGRPEMTRTGPGRARCGCRQFGSFGVPDLQSSEAPEIGAVHLDSQHAVPNFQSSEVVDAWTAAHRTSMLRMQRRAGRRCLVTGTSRGCSRIGNSHEKFSTLFSPVPPPLPGCAGFPTSHPPQVTCGRLGSEEVAVGQGKTETEKKEEKKGGRGRDAAHET